MWHIAILFKSHKSFRSRLDSDPNFQYHILNFNDLDEENNRYLLEKIDVIVVAPYQIITASVLDKFPNLKLILVNGSGTDKVPVNVATDKGILVVNAPDAIAESVAEHALGLTISLLKKIVFGDRLVRSGRWSKDTPIKLLIGRSVKNKVVGIVGLGRIGSALAKLFKEMGSHVVYWSRMRRPEVEHALNISYKDLETLLGVSDIVIISIALTSETRNFIDRERIWKMKDGAILVNVSRGGVIDEDALVEALENNRLGGAALDVYRVEPLPYDHPLTKFDNVVLTPHIAGFGAEALEETGIQAYELLRDIFVEHVLPYPNIVNKEVIGKIKWLSFK